MAYLDLGNRFSSECILLLHGEPSHGMLYRKMTPTLVSAGFRVIVPDLIGFGQSDKFGKQSTYTYDRHVTWLADLVFGVLNLGGRPGQRLTLFCQDWGGLLGLRLVAAAPHRFHRVATANTFLPTGEAPMRDTFKRWLHFSQTAPDLPVGEIVRMGCARDVSDAVVAAYDAPYDGFDHKALAQCGLDVKAAARRFPALVPVASDMAGAAQNKAAWLVLQRFQRPWLCAFSDGDPITAGADAVIRGLVPGTSAPGVAHATIRNAGHFLQEDAGEELAVVLRDFVLATGRECAALVDGPALAILRDAKL